MNARKWAEEIIKRDGCCQKTGNITNAWPHTILDHKLYPRTQYEMWNGICLDYSSHKEFHDKYGYRGFTLENLEEFLGHELPREQRLHLAGYEVANAIDFNFYLGLN